MRFVGNAPLIWQPWRNMATNTEQPMLGRLALHPLFGGFTTVCGVVAGYLGALYAEPIAASYWPLFLPGVVFSAKATSFWTATFLFGACFAGTLREQARVSKEATELLASSTSRIEGQTVAIAETAGSLGEQITEIEARTSRLLEVAASLDQKTSEVHRQTDNVGRLVQRLHTLPPVGFLDTYAQAGKLVVQIAIQSAARPSAGDLEALIRSQLVCILNAVSSFDANGDKCRYGANVMLYRESTGISSLALAELQTRLKFAESGAHLSNMRGCLDLQTRLSVSTDSRGDPDPQLIGIALPLPILRPGENALDGPVLPGAPYTFLSREPTVFEAASDLDKVRLDGKFSKFVMDAMGEFFQSRKEVIRSFACFAIYPPLQPDAGPIGVLNIHRDQENPSAAERIPLLNPLLVPLCAGVGALLYALSNPGATLPSSQKEKL